MKGELGGLTVMRVFKGYYGSLSGLCARIPRVCAHESFRIRVIGEHHDLLILGIDIAHAVRLVEVAVISTITTP